MIVCKGISQKVKAGQDIELDIAEGSLIIINTGETIMTDKLGVYAMIILQAGGIKPLMREKMRILKEVK